MRTLAAWVPGNGFGRNGILTFAVIKLMKKLIIALLALPLAIGIYSLKIAAKDLDQSQTNNQQSVLASSLFEAKASAKAADGAKVTNVPAVAQNAPTAPETQPQAMPVAWRITKSPHTVATTEKINTALAVYQGMGMTKQGAAYLIGNFITESHLDHTNCHGDGGTACGLGQWRFNRQIGMPMHDYVEQLKWAVNVEMQRHTPALRTALMNPNATVGEIQHLLYKWEVWGVQGARFHYGAAILAQL